MAFKKLFRIRNEIVRDMFAEFIGTFLLVTFAIGSGAQFVLSRGTQGSILTVNFAGGLGLTFGIYWAGGVSGASLNPAVTLAFCLQGIMPWWKYPFYVIAEMIGAFLGACVQYGIYYDAINAYDGGLRSTYGENATAGIFATFPNPDVSTLNCYFDQVFGTFILIGCIFAISDAKNMKPYSGLLPIAMGAIVFGIGICWSWNCGYPLNPARDLAPRIFTALAGWGIEPFSYRDYNWFWVPIVGPFTGAVIGWFVYNIFIQLHWPDEDEEMELEPVSPLTEKPESGNQRAGYANPAYSHDPVKLTLVKAIKQESDNKAVKMAEAKTEPERE